MENNFIGTNHIDTLLSDMYNEQDFEFPSELLPVQFDEANIAAIYDQSKKIMSMMVEYTCPKTTIHS